MFDSSKVSKDQRTARKTRRATNMGRKPRISLENRGKELALSEDGYSQGEVAHRVGCSQRSVRNIFKKQRLNGCVRDRKILGRKRKTTSKEDRIIVRRSKADKFKTAPEIKVEMQVEMCVFNLPQPDEG